MPRWSERGDVRLLFQEGSGLTVMIVTEEKPASTVVQTKSIFSSPAESIYFRLMVTGLARSQEEEFSEFCFAHQAAGLSEELTWEQADLSFEPQVVDTSVLVLNVYFSKMPDENLLLLIQGKFPKMRCEMWIEENRDWMEEWKKGFKPFLFSPPFWIVPSWFAPPPEVADNLANALFVDPGMAFGTGTHETTRLAAGLLIEEILRSPPESLLDVGTGTAILALVAMRMGVGRIACLDNDPEARRTARENLARNGASRVRVPDHALDQEVEIYDVVVANIIDGVLIQLAGELARVLRPGGRMVLSGILVERARGFRASFQAKTGLKLVKETREGEWSAAILEKPV